MSNVSGGLVAAILLDGTGGGKLLDWEGVARWKPEQGVIWVHLDFSVEEARQWIEQSSGIDATIAQAMLAEEVRPRSVVAAGGLMLLLRGANLNASAEAEDMVAIRCWFDRHRIITTRDHKVMTIDSIRDRLGEGNGPDSPGGFLVHLATGLTLRIGAALSELHDEVDALEDEVLDAESYDLRTRISGFRRSAIRFRRYLAPQKDTIIQLQNERVDWLTESHRAQLREIADRTLRFVEDIDSARDRAAVAQDELNNRLSERMNKTMYVLSVIAGIFLPLGLLTGLLGINVGGMPGVDSGSAFLVVCLILVVTAGMQTYLFRRKGWM